MNFSTLEKDFCCLKMKEEIQAKIYAEIKDMTVEERLEYFNVPPEKSIFKLTKTNMKNTKI